MPHQGKSAVFTASWIARILGLPELPALIRHPGFHSIVTDSRKITPGCLFLAMKGENHDGHAFIPTAIAQGATGIIHHEGIKLPGSAKAGTQNLKASEVLSFPVADTRAAYRALAAAWRREFEIPVVMVAGSVGKTTTKELLAAILHGKWSNVLKTEASQNGFDGIPKTLLNLRAEHQVAVIEVGIDEPGAMAQHLEVVAPSTSILTAIGPEHLETLGSVEKVAQEEGLALSEVSKKGGMIVINLDDPHIAAYASDRPGARQVCYALRENSSAALATGLLGTAGTVAHHPVPAAMTVTAEFEPDGKSIRVTGLALKKALFQMPVSGKHNGRNLLGAIAVALSLGLRENEIQNGLKTFKGPTGRSEVIELRGQIKVICDYYNASPPSMVAGFELLHDVHAETHHKKEQMHAKKWACLGDMLELGTDEKTFHKSLAPSLLFYNVDAILLYGPRMKALYEELQKKGYMGLLKHFDQQGELAKTLIAGMHPGDTILIKGSRSMKMEEVWKILQNYANSHQTS